MQPQNRFLQRAKDWDKLPRRVQNAKSVAAAIDKECPLSAELSLLDFGVGTGLLGFEILPYVKEIVGVDTSEVMLEQLQEKNTKESFITPHLGDILQTPLEKKFDGVISSMTLHHIENLEHFFQTMAQHLQKDGFIAIADLEKEDGTFHSNNEGVFHFGFEAQTLKNIAQNNGFKNIKIKQIHTIQKTKEYGVFLLTAQKK